MSRPNPNLAARLLSHPERDVRDLAALTYGLVTPPISGYTPPRVTTYDFLGFNSLAQATVYWDRKFTAQSTKIMQLTAALISADWNADHADEIRLIVREALPTYRP